MHSGETSAETATPAPPSAAESALPDPPPPEAKPDPCVLLLEKFLEQARAGKLRQLVIGYLLTNNEAAVRSTSMPAAVMGHLSRLIERRVNADYDRAARMAEVANNPGTQPGRTGGSSTPPAEPPAEPTPKLPRKVRQMLKKAEKRKAKK